MEALAKGKRKAGRLPSTKPPFKDLNLKDVGRDKGFRTESRSELSDRIHPDGMKFENTYKLGPDEDKRFVCHIAEKKMNEMLKDQLEDLSYQDAKGSYISTELATQIKKEMHQFPWARYKYVVQVLIGENKDQDVKIGSRCLWNKNTDTYACGSYSNKTLFAVATCFAIYFD